VGTFFFRNRAELELLIQLVNQQPEGAAIDVGIVACSKGAEVYSVSYGIRSARPDLKLNMRAVDIARDIVEFAERGVYSSTNVVGCGDAANGAAEERTGTATTTARDQSTSIFERMSSEEMEAMFDREEDQLKVKSQFCGGISWHVGDAGDPGIVDSLGLQDIVVANRFLCHMCPDEAQRCLRNMARLVKAGGYLFVSGVDLDVRTRVATDLGWSPVTERIKEIHEGDPSLRRDWPLQYWGLEPFDDARTNWQVRYASVFRIGREAKPARLAYADSFVPALPVTDGLAGTTADPLRTRQG
jgi:chemotaxis methyl-accepting protein methylase